MNKKDIWSSIYALATKQKAFVAILVMLIGMLFSGTQFYTTYNLLDMLNSTSILLILAFGAVASIIFLTTRP